MESNYSSSCWRPSGTLLMKTRSSTSPPSESPAENHSPKGTICTWRTMKPNPKTQYHDHLLATAADTADTELSPHFHWQCQHRVTIFHNHILAYCFQTAKVSVRVATTRYCVICGDVRPVLWSYHSRTDAVEETVCQIPTKACLHR